MRQLVVRGCPHIACVDAAVTLQRRRCRARGCERGGARGSVAHPLETATRGAGATATAYTLADAYARTVHTMQRKIHDIIRAPSARRGCQSLVHDKFVKITTVPPPISPRQSAGCSRQRWCAFSFHIDAAVLSAADTRVSVFNSDGFVAGLGPHWSVSAFFV